jgi:alcohol dehydrogenase class IV
MTTKQVIVRWGLAELAGLLEELGIEHPFVVASDRWSHLEIPASGRWREVPTDRIGEVAEAARGSDGLLAVGGGSAIDLAKAVSSATSLRLVSVPTTYSGAEWTRSFPIRDRVRRVIGRSLSVVLVDGQDLEARKTLLEGAMHGGLALAAAGLGLAHAMAQVVGGSYGLHHGAANTLCLPPVLRFNETAARAEIASFGHALGANDPAARVEELARLSGHGRLRDIGVPEDALREVAEATASQPGALANPRSASPQQIFDLFRSIW